MKTVELHEIEGFTAYLRSQGFASGAGERVRALRLFQAVPASQRTARLKTRLAPVFARDSEEQRRFYRAFDLYFQPAAVVSTAEEPLSRPVDRPADGRRPARRIPWRLLVVIAVTVAVLLLVWMLPAPASSSRQQAVPDPGRELAEIIERRIDAFRACSGWECFTADWRPFAAAAPFALLALWLIVRRRGPIGRVATRLRERRLGGPFEWPLRVEPPPLGPSVQRAAQSASGELARRLAADTEELDIPATLYETARQAGFPLPRFIHRYAAPEYLFVIEEQSPADHLAAWFDTVAVTLEKRGVRIDRYHYRHTPRVCFRPGSAETVTFRRLLQQHAGQRVLVFGDPKALGDPFSGGLASWAHEIGRQESRAWLTPAAAFQWGIGEARAAQWIRVVPARMSQLATLARLFEAPSAGAAGEAGADELPIPPADLTDATSRPDVLELQSYLDPGVFQWLAACAVHSDINWHLTCRLALAAVPDGGLLEERPLLQLIRLPWFRHGRIPPHWRSALMRSLDPAVARRTHGELITWLGQNEAPPGSFARRVQDAQVAAHRFYLDPSDARGRAAAAVALSYIARADVTADPTLGRLASDLRAGSDGGVGQRVKTTYHVWRFAHLVPTVLAIAAAGWTAGWLTRVPFAYEEVTQEYRYQVSAGSATAPSGSTRPDVAGSPRTSPGDVPPTRLDPVTPTNPDTRTPPPPDTAKQDSISPQEPKANAPVDLPAVVPSTGGALPSGIDPPPSSIPQRPPDEKTASPVQQSAPAANAPAAPSNLRITGGASSETDARNAAAFARAPQRFVFTYQFSPSPGPRYWTREGPNVWVERYETGETTLFELWGRTTIDGDEGTIVRRKDATMDVFIPDRGSKMMWTRFRQLVDGRWGSWAFLGEMQDVR